MKAVNSRFNSVIYLMLTAAIFSKYPARYVLEKVVPKLNERGVNVERIYDVTRVNAAKMGGCDCVLVMRELISHSEYDRICDLATRSNKPLYTISRKSAVWTRELKVLFDQAGTKTMAKPKSVTDEALSDLLKEVWKHRNDGLSFEQIVPMVKKYWSYGELVDGKHLTRYVNNAVERDACPPWWKKYVAGDPDASPPGYEEIKTISNPRDTSPPSQDGDELARIYSEENSSLRDENADLKRKIHGLEKSVEKLTQKLRVTAKSDGATSKDVIDAYRQLAHGALHAIQTMDRYYGFTSSPRNSKSSFAEAEDSSEEEAEG